MENSKNPLKPKGLKKKSQSKQDDGFKIIGSLFTTPLKFITSHYTLQFVIQNVLLIASILFLPIFTSFLNFIGFCIGFTLVSNILINFLTLQWVGLRYLWFKKQLFFRNFTYIFYVTVFGLAIKYTVTIQPIQSIPLLILGGIALLDTIINRVINRVTIDHAKQARMKKEIDMHNEIGRKLLVLVDLDYEKFKRIMLKWDKKTPAIKKMTQKMYVQKLKPVLILPFIGFIIWTTVRFTYPVLLSDEINLLILPFSAPVIDFWIIQFVLAGSVLTPFFLYLPISRIIQEWYYWVFGMDRHHEFFDLFIDTADYSYEFSRVPLQTCHKRKQHLASLLTINRQYRKEKRENPHPKLFPSWESYYKSHVKKGKNTESA